MEGHYICALVVQVVHAITGTAIVTEPPTSPDVVDLQEFYELIEKHRLESTDRLVKKYRNISPLLGKIEEVRCGGCALVHLHGLWWLCSCPFARVMSGYVVVLFLTKSEVIDKEVSCACLICGSAQLNSSYLVSVLC
jgi:hypothetical protein